VEVCENVSNVIDCIIDNRLIYLIRGVFESELEMQAARWHNSEGVCGRVEVSFSPSTETLPRSSGGTFSAQPRPPSQAGAASTVVDQSSRVNTSTSQGWNLTGEASKVRRKRAWKTRPGEGSHVVVSARAAAPGKCCKESQGKHAWKGARAISRGRALSIGRHGICAPLLEPFDAREWPGPKLLVRNGKHLRGLEGLGGGARAPLASLWLLLNGTGTSGSPDGCSR
jgi:hypothetical protein